MSTEIEQLQNLPVAEKLRIVEQLWDDIHASDEPLVIQDWHKAETRRRSVELEESPETAITRQELWKHVDEPNG